MKYIDAMEVDRSAGSATATLFVDPSAEYLRDHFPGAPTLPGLVMLEACVRVAGALWESRPSGRQGSMLERLDRLLLVRRVVPGETLAMRVEFIEQSSPGRASFQAEGTVSGQAAMRARFRLGTAFAEIEL